MELEPRGKVQLQGHGGRRRRSGASPGLAGGLFPEEGDGAGCVKGWRGGARGLR